MTTFQRVVLTVALLGFGLAMIAAPDLMQGGEASGRNSLFKALLINVWSIPGGVISLGAGAASAFLLFRQPQPSALERKVAPRKKDQG